MAPNLLLYPVLNEAEALAGVSNREVVHPTAYHRVDQLDQLTDWLRLMAAKYILKYPQQLRALLELWGVIRTPIPATTAHTTKVKAEEAEAFVAAEVHGSTLLFVDLDL